MKKALPAIGALAVLIAGIGIYVFATRDDLTEATDEETTVQADPSDGSEQNVAPDDSDRVDKKDNAVAVDEDGDDAIDEDGDDAPDVEVKQLGNVKVFNTQGEFVGKTNTFSDLGTALTTTVKATAKTSNIQRADASSTSPN